MDQTIQSARDELTKCERNLRGTMGKVGTVSVVRLVQCTMLSMYMHVHACTCMYMYVISDPHYFKHTDKQTTKTEYAQMLQCLTLQVNTGSFNPLCSHVHPLRVIYVRPLQTLNSN